MLQRSIKNILKLTGQEQGAALPIVLACLALGALIVGPFLVHASTNSISSNNYLQMMKENYAADAAVEQAIWSLTSGNLAAQIPNPGDSTSYALPGQVNGLIPGIIVTNGGNSGGTVTNYQIQSTAGGKILFASVNVNGSTASVLSWQYGNASGNNPIPRLTGISPPSGSFGNHGFTLTINGTGFTSSSLVCFQGSPRSTTFISSSQLTAGILDSDLAVVGTFPVTVANPDPGGGVSNSQIFSVTSPQVDHYLVTVPPSNQTAGVAFTVTVQAQDASNNFITSGQFSSETVNLSFNQSEFAPTPVSVTTSNGAVSFSMVLLTAHNGLNITATGASSSKSGVSSNFTVLPGPLHHIVVTPSNPAVVASGNLTFTAQGQDVFNNNLNGLSYSWSCSDTHAGSINSNGNFTAGTTAGTYNNVITATSGSKTGTASVQVNPGVAATLAVATQHGGTETAGTGFSVTLTAKDSYGNTATGYNGSHTINWTWTATNSPNNTVPVKPFNGNQNFNNGIATVSGFLLFNAGQTPTISATDTLISGASAGITVIPGSLASFNMTGYPASAVAGSNFGTNNVVITAYDAYSNIATNYTGSIYFTSSDSQAVLPYTSGNQYTFTTGSGSDNGIHTFAGTGFTLMTSGTQTITITNGTISKTGASITVNNPPWYASIPATFTGTNSSGSANGNNTQTMNITFIVGNNNNTSSATVNAYIKNNLSRSITIQSVTVTASTSNGPLGNLTITTGGALGTYQFKNFNLQGTQTQSISKVINANQQSAASVKMTTPKNSQGTYTITVSFTYQ